MLFAHRGGRWITRVVAQDALLLVAAGVGLAGGTALGKVLALAIACTLLWGFVTLHDPSRVEVTDDAIVFSAYGRSHVFHWRDVERIHVRRFLVRGRAFVRISPAPAWRGRYWLTDALDGFDVLVEELTRRSTASELVS